MSQAGGRLRADRDGGRERILPKVPATPPVLSARPARLAGTPRTARNALRANLVKRAEQWRWSSLWRREHGDEAAQAILSPWPIPQPAEWTKLVNAAQTEAELAALRRSVARGTPFGSASWTERTARRLGLEYTLRSRGRPRKMQGRDQDGA